LSKIFSLEFNIKSLFTDSCITLPSRVSVTHLQATRLKAFSCRSSLHSKLTCIIRKEKVDIKEDQDGFNVSFLQAKVSGGESSKQLPSNREQTTDSVIVYF
jgi:transcriptional accessory protein Tex/SPT6